MKKNTAPIPAFSCLLLSIIIVIVTFPTIDGSYGTGIDSPVEWLFNYLYFKDISLTKNLIFPHGPLAFLQYPLAVGDNLIWGNLAIGILRTLFVYTLLYLGTLTDRSRWLLSAFVALILCELLALQGIMIGIVAGGLLIYKQEKNAFEWLLTAVIVAVLGLYIKASIGIIAFLILGSFMLVRLLFYRKILDMILIVCLLPLFVALLWFGLYQNIHWLDIHDFLYGIFNLAKDNSAAVSFYPDNNWWLIGASMIGFFSLPFLMREKRVYFLYAILLLSLFGAWKHGMSREDFFHARALLRYLCLFFALLLLVSKKLKVIHFVWIQVILLLFYSNMPNVVDFKAYKLRIFTINDLNKLVFDYKNTFNAFEWQSKMQLKSNQLSPAMRSKIGEETVDIYPWDYSILAANHLNNWQPRPVLQSYATYTHWLDRQNERHWNSDIAPEFVIWQLDKSTTDIFGSDLAGIDQRYLLNDEPLALLAFFENYDLLQKDDRFLLFQKKAQKTPFNEPQIIGEVIGRWGKWLPVPKRNQRELLRAKWICKGNWKRLLQTQLFKDQSFWLDYQLLSGEMRRYRIVPSTAADGLWINPLVLDIGEESLEEVVNIRFVCPDETLMLPTFTVTWESLVLGESKVTDWLGWKAEKRNLGGSQDTAIHRKFEERDFSKEEFIGTFSNQWSDLKLPSKEADSLQIEASISFKTDVAARFLEAKLWISVEDSVGTILSESGRPLRDFLILPSQYNLAQHRLSFPLKSDLKPSTVVKAFIWNEGKQNLHLEEMNIIFR